MPSIDLAPDFADHLAAGVTTHASRPITHKWVIGGGVSLSNPSIVFPSADNGMGVVKSSLS
eukprot:scaffold31_cov334-Pavlova_lutheri.AAC.32